jgi:hypothetical protein
MNVVIASPVFTIPIIKTIKLKKAPTMGLYLLAIIVQK